MKKLEPRQKRFVQEYLKDLNATQAAIRSGYSKKTARIKGAKLLSKANIQKAIKAAMKKREEKTEITAARVLQELAICGFSDIKNHVEINEDTGALRVKGFDEMPADSSRAVKSIYEDRIIREDSKGDQSVVDNKLKFKLHDKIKALELIGKHLGMFPTKIEGQLELQARLSIAALKKSAKACKDGAGS